MLIDQFITQGVSLQQKLRETPSQTEITCHHWLLHIIYPMFTIITRPESIMPA